MLNMHLRNNPPSSWRILFQYGGRPRKFICLKFFRALVVPGRGCIKGIILHGFLTPMGVLPNGHSYLRRKGDVTGASVHAPRHRNSIYVQTFRRSIYNTILPEHPHSPIHQYKRHLYGPPSRPLYIKYVTVEPLVDDMEA